ncbi:hypothetical protein ACFLU5_01760 [Bacteroidota bacterium]
MSFNRFISGLRIVLFTLILGLMFVLFSHIPSYSQGCSDAGFCTMGAMKPDQQFNKKIPVKLRALVLNLYRGTTTLSPVLFVGTLDLTIGIGNHSSLQVKLPYQTVEGNLGNTSGLGDISLSYTRKVLDTETWDVAFTIGGKIPSNHSDLKKENDTVGYERDLPMYYQVSLGSWDLVAGGSVLSKDWLFATGIQIALTENNNHFKWSDWPDYPNPKYIEKHDKAAELKRGTDFMIRVERNFRFGRFNGNIGLLPIWRITKDEILDGQTGERIKLDGTTGMALSALGGIGYQINVNNGIKFLYGHKLTQRDVNPDGLTRHNVMSVSYVYRF